MLRKLASAVLAVARTKSVTLARLKLLHQPEERPRGGYFRFPFGLVRFTDAGALAVMYQEHFVSKIYDVTQLPERPYIVDCGGNIGLSTIWFKLCYPQARVTVFEADPFLAEILAENVRTLDLKSVEVVKAAVGARNDTVRFSRHRSLTGYVDEQQGIPIECVRLSDRLNEPVDLLKIDIEGSEFNLLNDLIETGKIGLVDHLICEVHGSTSLQDKIFSLLSALSNEGFSLTVGGAETNERLPGPPDPTPFTGVASGKFILFLYAWRRAPPG